MSRITATLDPPVFPSSPYFHPHRVSVWRDDYMIMARFLFIDGEEPPSAPIAHHDLIIWAGKHSGRILSIRIKHSAGLPPRIEDLLDRLVRHPQATELSGEHMATALEALKEWQQKTGNRESPSVSA